MGHCYEFVVKTYKESPYELVGMIEHLNELENYKFALRPNVYDMVKKCCREAMMPENDQYTISVGGIYVYCRSVY